MITPTPWVPEPDQFATPDGLIARQIRKGAEVYRTYATARGAGGAIHFAGAHRGVRFNDPGLGAQHALAPSSAVGAAPDVGGYLTCYVGVSPEAAFVEVFFRRLPTVAVAWTELATRSIGKFVLARDLTVVCLSAVGLLRLGVAGDIVTGRDYALAQVVARRLWRHPAAFDGIEYPTRHDTGERSIALFDRARSALPLGSMSVSAELDPEGPLVAAFLERYGFDIFDDRP